MRDLKIAGRIAAIAWYLYNPSEFSAANDQTREHYVPGPGIQIVTDNIAIELKNIFSDVGTRSFLDSFVGEVHITLPICSLIQADRILLLEKLATLSSNNFGSFIISYATMPKQSHIRMPLWPKQRTREQQRALWL